MAEEKQTQGHDKMLLYIEDLIRNKNFIRLIRRVKKLRKKNSSPTGMYSDWTPEEQKEHDRINDEFAIIIDGYENLRKRCKKLMRDKHFIIREKIASEYGLDDGLIHLALEMHEKDDKGIKFYQDYSEPDMCKIVNIYEETMSPFNKGEEIIYLRRDLQLLFNSHPMAVVINSNASKRDVLDFIEKKWKRIDSSLRQFDNQKGLKIRKRKHSQELVDFIWVNQGLSSKQIIKKLDEKFPDHNLVYYEVSKIIQLEKQKRAKILFE